MIDKLFREKRETVDHNLKKLKQFIKPQAKNLYYSRKAEFLNLVVEKN